MPYINDAAFDQGLNYINANGARIDLTTAEATTYAEATSTLSIANKTGLSVTAPANGDVDGRKVTTPAITDGSVTGTDTATHWALTDGAGILLAAGPLSASQSLFTGNTFTLGSINITLRDAVAV